MSVKQYSIASMSRYQTSVRRCRGAIDQFFDHDSTGVAGAPKIDKSVVEEQSKAAWQLVARWLRAVSQ